MKNVITMKKAIIVALATIFSTALLNSASATQNLNDVPGVVVKYLGVVDNNPVFEIVFNSNEIDNYVVRIKDENGTVIFTEKLKGKNMSRRYRIDTEQELGEDALWFEVKAIKTKKTDLYVAGVREDVKRSMAINKLQ